jgi:hypothetical protein
MEVRVATEAETDEGFFAGTNVGGEVDQVHFRADGGREVAEEGEQ